MLITKIHTARNPNRGQQSMKLLHVHMIPDTYFIVEFLPHVRRRAARPGPPKVLPQYKMASCPNVPVEMTGEKKWRHRPDSVGSLI